MSALPTIYELLINMILQKTNKATQEKFQRRKKSLVSKANELKLLCDADVYLLIRRRGKFYTYSSLANSWPPSPETIVSSSKDF